MNFPNCERINWQNLIHDEYNTVNAVYAIFYKKILRRFWEHLYAYYEQSSFRNFLLIEAVIQKILERPFSRKILKRKFFRVSQWFHHLSLQVGGNCWNEMPKSVFRRLHNVHKTRQGWLFIINTMISSWTAKIAFFLRKFLLGSKR